jgi:hypothetical protein
MRIRSALIPILATATFVAAQPAPPEGAPPPQPGEPAPLPPPPPPGDPAPLPPAPPAPEEPAPLPPPAAPAPAVTISSPSGVPPSALPPITINITNNNSNTNAQTNTAPVTVSTPATVSTPVTVSAPPPSLTPAFPSRSVVEHYEVHAHARSQLWLLLAVTGGEHRDGGVRASIDLLTSGQLALGIGAMASGGELGGHEHGRRGGHDRERSAGDSADVYVAYTTKVGLLDVRALIGIAASRDTRRHGTGMRSDDDNAIARTTTGDTGGESSHGHGMQGIRAAGEAALLVGLPLGRHIGLVGGPTLTTTDVGKHGQVDATMFAGLRCGL